MIGRRSYSGGAIDGGYQHISERPELEKEAEDVVYATDPEPVGEERTDGVPELDDQDDIERPDVDGQSTLEDWGWPA